MKNETANKEKVSDKAEKGVSKPFGKLNYWTSNFPPNPVFSSVFGSSLTLTQRRTRRTKIN